MTVDAQEFLDVIFQDRAEDETICVSKMIPADGERDQPGFWNVPSTHGAFRKWCKRQGEEAWYFCVSAVTEEWNEKATAIKRKGSNVTRAFALVLDDIGTKAEAPPLEPTWKLESSEGNEQWGYALLPTDDVQTYEALVEWCHAQGWGDGGAGGSWRIMRVPGSVNLKPGRGMFRSVVTHWDPEVAWTLAELIEDFGSPDLDAFKDKRKISRPRMGSPDEIDPVLTWLADRGLLRQDDGGDWVDVLCPWAERHTTGGDVAGYSPLGRGSGAWVQRRAFKCQHEHCAQRSLRDFREWVEGQDDMAPAVAGFDPLPWLQRRYVMVTDGSVVADMEQRERGGFWTPSLDEWAKLYPQKIYARGHDKPVIIKTAFLEDERTMRADTFAYVPGDEPLAERWGQRVVNTYVAPRWRETAVGEEPEVFLDHVEYLLPDADEQDVFLDWLAYKIQHPASRSYAMVMVADGAFGTGRSWLRAMLSAMLGGKVNTASFPQLIGKGSAADKTYNDWQAGCQFVVVEEARDNMDGVDFYHGYETFKSLVDTRVTQARINPKYGKTRDELIYFNLLVFSNHADALALPAGDRRVCVLTNPSERRDGAYYDRLQAALADDGEARRLYWWLMRRDVSAFDHIYPPMTEAKALMTEMSRSPAEEIEAWVIENAAGDLVTRSVLCDLVRSAALGLQHEGVAQKPEAVAKKLWRKLGPLDREDRKNGARVTVGGTQQEVRALKNKMEWMKRWAAREISSMSEAVERNNSNNVIAAKFKH